MIGLNLVILFKLAAELAFLFGLYAKTQARAVTYGVSVFAAMSFLPVVVRIGIREIWACDVLYLSPIADLLVSEFPWLGVKWTHLARNSPGIVEWQFYPLLHCRDLRGDRRRPDGCQSPLGGGSPLTAKEATNVVVPRASQAAVGRSDGHNLRRARRDGWRPQKEETASVRDRGT